MKSVLIVGSGGREHAMAWRMAQSEQVGSVYVAPGNGGTAQEHKCENVAIAAHDIESLLNFARDHSIDLTVVGPEAPLVAGIVDRFSAAGLRCFGPREAAAQLEGSKAFAKDFMARHGIPTARYDTFDSVAPAVEYIRRHGAPIVVKADGLAAGKGVVVAQTVGQAERAVKDMLADNAFGDAGATVVIEEFLAGEEASFIVVADGLERVALATSQDHKARDDGDQGPNTGGMGAYSPAPVVTSAMEARILKTIIDPVLRGMREDGCEFRGFLYAGLMITPDLDIRVLEFNVRCGDPETQPIMMRLTSDLYELLVAACEGELKSQQPTWDERCALAVVMAAEGYPGSYEKGHPMTFTAHEDSKVFHAGTRQTESGLVTSGGRVVAVGALGSDVVEAQTKAYAGVRSVHWEGAFFRSDIGYRALRQT